MTFLINCSNLKAGGGLQVADSVCDQIVLFHQHKFVIVLSPYMMETKARITDKANTEVFFYEIPNNFKTIIMGHDIFLDKLVEEKRVDAVLTIFGPSRWIPRIPHLSGFAMAFLVLTESPFFQRMTWVKRIQWKLWCQVRQWSFKRSAQYLWTENPYITERLNKLLINRKIFTISNYYNQIYDHPELWKIEKKLPQFDGTTCFAVSTYYPHKNFEILIEVVNYLVKKFPDFNARFVLTFDAQEMPVPDNIKNYFLFIGKVDVSDCPYLYQQCDIMFMPTLLECFTATYPEAMRMEKPIVTTDLEFARGLCGDAACYYSAVDAKAAAEAIYKVATDKGYAQQLVQKGKKQLTTYDNYVQRAEKLIGILEDIAKKNV